MLEVLATIFSFKNSRSIFLIFWANLIRPLFSKNSCKYFCGNFWKNLGYFFILSSHTGHDLTIAIWQQDASGCGKVTRTILVAKYYEDKDLAFLN